MTLTTDTKVENVKTVTKQKSKAPASLIAGWVVLAIACLLALAVLAGSVVSAYAGTNFNIGNLVSANFAKAISANSAEAEETISNTEKVSNADMKETAIVVAAEAEGSTEAVKTAEVAETEPEEEVAEATPEKPEWHYYNQDIQDNGVAADDFNFGPNPIYSNLDLEKVKSAISGKAPTDTVKVSDLISEAETDVIDKDFRERLRKDPALGAADMAWADSLLGTRYLGVFYDECKEKWDAAMNSAKEAWIEDSEDYFQTLDAFEEYLDSATKVEIRSIDKKLSDQMYMNPHTKNGVPDIIVMTTTDHSGWYLVYTFTIKETKKVEVMYRIDCGYQPTDVAKVMKVTAKKKSSVVGGGGTTKKTGGGGIVAAGGGFSLIGGGGGYIIPPGPNPNPNPKPDPDPTPKYNKDPNQGIVTEPNDSSGPGENTNTGKGGQYSSKDQVGNSNDMTQEEYKETINEMKEANSNIGGGGDGETPSTDAPSEDTHEDNPGASDDGHTETSDSSVADDDAGDSWDGPSD